MVAIVFLLGAFLAQTTWVFDENLPSRLSKNDLAEGKKLYETYCQKCHGPYGDDMEQEGITPISGLSLRLGDPRNKNFGGPSFRARGKIYSPEEARNLMGYILTLKGEKAFPRGENLAPPHLLNRKIGNRNYLLIDARSEPEFRKSHVPGAVNVPPKAFARLKRPTLAPDLSGRIVIIYDEGPGLRSAMIWRAVFDSGHRRVAILDGGFKRWVSEDRTISTEPSALAPGTVFVEGKPQPKATPAAGSSLIDLRPNWRSMIAESGLKNATETDRAIRAAGFKGPGRYRVKGESGSADLSAFCLHLLGFSIEAEGGGLVIR